MWLTSKVSHGEIPVSDFPRGLEEEPLSNSRKILVRSTDGLNYLAKHKEPSTLGVEPSGETIYHNYSLSFSLTRTGTPRTHTVFLTVELYLPGLLLHFHRQKCQRERQAPEGTR